MKGTVSSEVDFISNLPHSIVEHILGFLPLGNVVRTSILSREWRYKWLYCPVIVFDSQFNKFLLEGHELKPLIYQILESHQGSLVKFALQVPHLRTCRDINKWVHLLPSDSLQYLTLHVYRGRNHLLTPHLFTFQNLKYLKLTNCVFIIPPGFKGFSKLVNIDIHNCSLEIYKFGNFVASCPVIEKIRLIPSTNFDYLEITGPKLKSFYFHGVFDSLSFKDCPVLSNVKLSISSKGFFGGPSSFDLVKSLSSLPLLENLELKAEILEELVEYGAPDKLPMALKTLKNLQLSHMVFMNTEEVSSAICFIRSCPSLQTLTITAFASETVESVAEFLRSQNTKGPESLTHLRTVKIERFSGVESEMEFVKYLLVSATALEEMIIMPHGRSIMGESEILNKLKQYPCASQTADIVTLMEGLIL